MFTTSMGGSAFLGHAPKCTIGFGVLVFLTATLFVRPSEIIPGLEELPIYEITILLCLAASLPAVIHQLSWRRLTAQPAHLCVLGMLPAIMLSHLSHANTWNARIDGLAFLKVLVFYFLVVSLLTTRRRVHIYLFSLLLFVTTSAILSVLTYHQVIEIGGLNPIEQRMGVDRFGDEISVPRLQGVGIFGDPNDFSLVLVAGMIIAVQLFMMNRRWSKRMVLVVFLGCLGYAFYLTRSRGGFLSLLGVAVVLICRYPIRRAIMVFLVAASVIIALSAGRQTNIDVSDRNDTAQGRIHLWRDSMVLFHQAPLFGIGSNQLAEVNALVAHNSYVQAFAELGVFGGVLFIGILVTLISDLARHSQFISAQGGLTAGRSGRRSKPLARDSALIGSVVFDDGWVHCLLAVIVGYAIGMISLTRDYEVSTYALFGVAAAYCAIRAIEIPEVVLVRGWKLVRRIGFVSVVVLLAIELTCRLLAV